MTKTIYTIRYRAPGMVHPRLSYALGVAPKEDDARLRRMLSTLSGAEEALQEVYIADGPRKDWVYFIDGPDYHQKYVQRGGALELE